MIDDTDAVKLVFGSQALWIPIVIFAAFAQTLRNTAQRTLTHEVGAYAATLARFLFGLPLAALLLVGVISVSPSLPHFGSGYAVWIAIASIAQAAATFFLLMAIRERNFVLAVTASKTEILQAALLSALFLSELPDALGLSAMVLATVGVLLMSSTSGSELTTSRGLTTWKLLGYGASSGACFAMASVSFRAASLSLGPDVSPWISGCWNLFWAQLSQSIILGGLVFWRQPQAVKGLVRNGAVSIVVGSTGALASLAWFTAYGMRPAADVRTLGLVEVLFSYVVSTRMLKEELTVSQVRGLVCVVIGLVLICLKY